MEGNGNFWSTRMEAVRIPASRSPIWSIAGGGVFATILLQIFLIGPITAELRMVRREMATVRHDVNALVGQQDAVWRSSDLLTSLQQQEQRLAEASAALAEVERLRAGVLQEAQAAEVAMQQLSQIHAVSEALVAQLPVVNEIALAAQQMEGLADRLSAVRSRIDTQMATIGHAEHALVELTQLQARITAVAPDTDRAHAQLSELIQLKEDVLGHTDTLASAVETFELLQQFQLELGAQTKSIAGMRTSLMEVALMEPVVARIAHLMQPLTELANLDRLGNREIREVARGVMDQRALRLSAAPTDSVRDSGSTGLVPEPQDVPPAE